MERCCCMNNGLLAELLAMCELSGNVNFKLQFTMCKGGPQPHKRCSRGVKMCEGLSVVCDLLACRCVLCTMEHGQTAKQLSRFKYDWK